MARFAAAPSGPPFDTLDSALIDALPVAVYVCDRDARIIRFNQRAVELWGREPSLDDRYCGSLRMIRPDGSVLPHHECPMADVLRTGEAARDAEVGIERPDGSRIVVRVTIVPLTDDTGNLVGAVNTFQDITQQKRTEAALHEREADLRDFVENATEGLHWVGPDGSILWANQAELDLLGYTRDEYVGRHVAEFHADREVIEHLLSCLSRGECLRNYEARLRCKDGSIRYVLISSNVLWRDGEFVHTRCFTRDVTERKLAESALRHQTELLKTVADNAASMILMMDAQGRGTYANPEATRVTGYRAEELLGHVLHDTLHYKYPDGRPYPASECPLDRALALGESVREVEDVFVRKDGTFVPVVCSAMPIVRDGKAIGTVIEARDITERKRADQALRLSEERFRSLSKCLPVGIFQNAIDGKCTYTNPRAASICGFTLEESLGDGWSNSVHPEDRERLYESWLAAVAERREWVDENRWLHRDGTVRWTICRAAPHVNDAGEVIGYIGTLEDITERKQAEELLKELDRRKDAFVATVAHELRQPLGAIHAALGLMRLRADREKGERARSTVERQVAQLARLVDDLLDAARVARGNVTLDQQRIALNDIIDAAVTIVQPGVRERDQQLSVAVPSDPIFAQGDALRLQQVFSNLLTNAVKFTDPGGRITVAVEQKTNKVAVRVRDTGRGIAPEMLPRVFDLFAQASQDGRGLGIGLAVVRGLVERHGGTVEARSDGPRRGSEFIVTLPVATDLAAS